MDAWMYFISGASIGVLIAWVAASHGFAGLGRQNARLREIVEKNRELLIENLTTVIDTVPEQQVKYALRQWREVLKWLTSREYKVILAKYDGDATQPEQPQ